MSLKLSRYLINRICIRRFASNDSSITTTDSKKKLTTKKTTTTELTSPKRAFTLIDPKTVHQIKRIDDVPLNNEMDILRHRLTDNRKSF